MCGASYSESFPSQSDELLANLLEEEPRLCENVIKIIGTLFCLLVMFLACRCSKQYHYQIVVLWIQIN
jgi:hypothetical protein